MKTKNTNSSIITAGQNFFTTLPAEIGGGKGIVSERNGETRYARYENGKWVYWAVDCDTEKLTFKGVIEHPTRL